MLPFSSLALSFSAFLIGSALAFPEDGSDLTSFVSRPDIKAPKFDVTIHNKDRVSPGYWFVAPYWQIPPEAPSSRYMPCQIGPHIYDGNGALVWSGACRFNNNNIFDFRTVVIDNTTYLSFIHGNDLDVDANSGYGLILDEQYHEKNRVDNDDHVPVFNMHEFNVVDNGKSALSTSYMNRLVDLNAWNMDAEGWVTSSGILDQDVETGEVLFKWDGHENIPLDESTIDWPWDPPGRPGWDYLHVNSVDKTPDGDYLLSSRFTDSVYMISKKGEIVWRLGGKINDFEYTNDLMFHRQHHVRHVESNSTHMTIQMLNNAADEYYQDGAPSAVLFILLDTSVEPMTATLLRHYDRPDKRLTRLRGSAQTLPDGNIFAGWSANGYQSEFTPDGELVMESTFISDRYSTYRSYKSEWTGRPTTPPAVKSAAFGSTTSEVSTVIWVSWNGATDIDSWNFYGRSSSHAEPVLIGNAPRMGFETQFLASGYMGWVEAEALDADGNALGKSDVEETNAPDNWQASGFSEEAPNPMDPSVIMKIKEEANTNLSSSVGGDSKQQPVSNQEPADDKSSSGGVVIFCIALAVVVGSGILLGLFWFFRPQLQQRSEKKTYLPVASDADEDRRYDRTL